MLVGLFIFLDDEFEDPLYGDPADPADLDPVVWQTACEAVNDALDEEGHASGVRTVSETHVAWNSFVKQGISFVAMVTDDVKGSDVERYLAHLARRYMDEVDDARNPEREGVEDVVVDVIPPWEDGDED
jgi:hypothetical protein